MTLNDVLAVADINKLLGEPILAVDVLPSFAYVDGKKTDVVSGYSVSCLLSEHKFERVSVKVTSKPDFESSDLEGNPLQIAFEGLSAKCWIDRATCSPRFCFSAEKCLTIAED